MFTRSMHEPLVHHAHQAAAGVTAYFHADRTTGEVSSHSHPTIQVSVVMKRIEEKIDPASTRIEIIPAGVTHSTRWDPTTEILALHLDPGFVAQSIDLDRASEEIELSRRTGADAFIASCGFILRKEFVRYGRPTAFLLEWVATALSARLSSTYAAGDRKTDPSVGVLTLHQLARVTEIIHDRLQHTVTVSELSDQIGVSRWHFSRVFKATTGMSPYQYLIRARVERARELLRSGISIAQASHMTGFSDQSHFNRHFKRKFGGTPGALDAQQPIA